MQCKGYTSTAIYGYGWGGITNYNLATSCGISKIWCNTGACAWPCMASVFPATVKYGDWDCYSTGSYGAYSYCAGGGNDISYMYYNCPHN